MGSQQQQRQRRWSKVRLGHKRSQMALQQGWEEGWLDRAVTVDAQRLTLYVCRLVCVLWSPLRGRVHTVRAEQSCDLKLSSLCSHSALLKGWFHWSSYREMIKRKKIPQISKHICPEIRSAAELPAAVHKLGVWALFYSICVSAPTNKHVSLHMSYWTWSCLNVWFLRLM